MAEEEKVTQNNACNCALRYSDFVERIKNIRFTKPYEPVKPVVLSAEDKEWLHFCITEISKSCNLNLDKAIETLEKVEIDNKEVEKETDQKLKDINKFVVETVISCR